MRRGAGRVGIHVLARVDAEGPFPWPGVRTKRRHVARRVAAAASRPWRAAFDQRPRPDAGHPLKGAAVGPLSRSLDNLNPR